MSGSTRSRVLAGTVGAALAVLGVFVSTSAGSSTSPPTPQAGAALLRQTTVFQPRRASAAAGKPYVYVPSQVVSLAARHYISGTIKCPASHPTPISGLFGSNSTAVYISFSEPNKGGWLTRIDNASTTAAAKIQIGTVCGL